LRLHYDHADKTYSLLGRERICPKLKPVKRNAWP
jgi:hypothetical protein